MIVFSRDRKTLMVTVGIYGNEMIFEFECQIQAPTEIDAELRLQAIRNQLDKQLQKRADDRARRLFLKWQKEGMPKKEKP